ncbi:hypothetical protein ACS0TY_022579 [Phlomoides rotata]
MGKSEIFRPDMLSDDDCWLVLCHTVCLEWNEVETFVDIGKKIAKKCNGLPFAATTLGDYEIKVESLIGNWMALGYLGSNSDDMELKGKECFDVLEMCSLFQDFNKDNDDWEIESCKMHDIVHDFAQYLRKSGREEAGGVEVAAEMNKNKRSQACDPSQVSNHVDEFCTLYCDGDSPPNLCNRFVRLRVLSLARCRLQGVPHEMDKLIHLRWLDLSGNELSTEDLKFIFQLYFLQTLNLSRCSLEEILNEIGNLCHLRHLNLSENRLKELPSEIGNLKQLRHLDLDDNDDLKELPSEIGKLSFLKTIILPDRVTIQIPEALGQLTGLRKLMGFKGGSGWSKLGLLKNLNQLADGMDLKGIVEDSREANFSNKKYIEVLELYFKDEMGEEVSSRMDVIDALKPHPNLRILRIWEYKGSNLPLWIVSPANQLRKVELYECDRLTSLPSFGNLPCLEELSLDGMKALEFELFFGSCPKWKEWEDITAEEEESSAFQIIFSC